MKLVPFRMDTTRYFPLLIDTAWNCWWTNSILKVGLMSNKFRIQRLLKHRSDTILEDPRFPVVVWGVGVGGEGDSWCSRLLEKFHIKLKIKINKTRTPWTRLWLIEVSLYSADQSGIAVALFQYLLFKQITFIFSTIFQIFMHGNNLGTLHQYMHEDILPAELGGSGKNSMGLSQPLQITGSKSLRTVKSRLPLWSIAGASVHWSRKDTTNFSAILTAVRCRGLGLMLTYIATAEIWSEEGLKFRLFSSSCSWPIVDG